MENESVYYNQPEQCSAYYDSLCKDPNFLESEEDVSDYASPTPLDYEVPDQSQPEIPAREPEGPSSYPPPLPRKGYNTVLMEVGSLETKEKKKLTLSKLYTALTHTHVPSVYCTPSHSMEFKRTNTAVSESTLDIVNLESSETTASPPPTPLQHEDKGSLSLHRPYQHPSRAKVAVLVFLVTAIAVAMISLSVSIVAVFVVTEGDTTSATPATIEAGIMENITSLQSHIQQLQRQVEYARNETSSATFELSSLYQNCLQEIRNESCSLPNREGFVCASEPLLLEKEGYMTLDRFCYATSHSDQYTLSTSVISSDSEEPTVYCQCRLEENVFIGTGKTVRVDCVLQMLRCSLQQRLEVVFNKN